MTTTATAAATVHGAWDATALCTGTYGGPLASAKHNPERITCPACLEALSPDTITRTELVQSIAATLSISTPEAARRVMFHAEELELTGTRYTLNAAGEIERCIAADLRAGK